MPKKNNINGIHAQRLKSIRSFVNFNYDLRKPLKAHQKSKIKKYFDVIDRLQARPNKLYRPRNKNRLVEAQRFSQHPQGLKGITVAFIPTATKDIKLSFDKNGKIALQTKHITTRDIEFNVIDLAIDPDKEIARAISEHPKAKRFTIKADENEIPRSYDKYLIAKGIKKLMLKYKEEEANNYFGNWLFGAKAHYYRDQDDFQSYQRAKEQASIKLRKKRRNKKDRLRKQRDK